ncbi:MAG TPA: 50S ribosomal protein L25 [Candidatus Limnocylindrales bacterium]
MSPDRLTLAAEERQTTGKAVAQLRRAGKLPAVVYGHGVDSSNVTLDAHEFELLRKHLGANALVDLSVGGKKADPVLVHEVQLHPVNRRPLHVDLFLVRMTEELTVDVPLHPVGESEAITIQGGTLLHAMETVRIRALPDHLPGRIEYSIAGLRDFEAAIHVRDLPIPTDATLLTDPDDLVARVLAPRVEEAAPVAEAPAAAEGAEPEAAAAGGSDQGSGGE